MKMAAPMNMEVLKFCAFCCRSLSFAKPRLKPCILMQRHLSTSQRRRISDKDLFENKSEKEFRQFDLQRGSSFEGSGRRRSKPVTPKPSNPRYMKMRVDQDWTAVWPTAHTFKWSVVPLPVRQGALKRRSEGKGDGLPPEKYGNAELMKIPNFLHLTPKHIKKHCEAIKKFCTPWPEELRTADDMKYHYPVEVITSDYCFSGPSVRDTRARVVTVKFYLDELELDYHARDKYLRLAGSRYDPQTGEVTLVADRCPLKQQNYDYIQYLMTALYFESWKTEAWEADKTEADMERYFWDISASKKNLIKLLSVYRARDQASDGTEEEKQLSYLPEDISEDSVASLELVKDYKTAVEELHNTGENYTTLMNYKDSVKKMLNVQTGSSQS